MSDLALGIVRREGIIPIMPAPRRGVESQSRGRGGAPAAAFALMAGPGAAGAPAPKRGRATSQGANPAPIRIGQLGCHVFWLSSLMNIEEKRWEASSLGSALNPARKPARAKCATGY